MLMRYNYQDERGRHVISEWKYPTITDPDVSLMLHVRRNHNDRVCKAWFDATFEMTGIGEKLNALQLILDAHAKEDEEFEKLWLTV